MAQQNWHLMGGWGRKYIVGLYHGTDSGHLVVHLNNQVLLVDFNVLDHKMYSFFIDQELYELTISPEGPDFSYELKVNTEADTPRNLERKANDRFELRQYLISILVTVVIFASLIILFSYLVKDTQ
jgi:hypothetical protein